MWGPEPRTASVIPRPTRSQEHALKADAFSQLTLLEVQKLDSRLDQLRHRLATLPETRELAALVADRSQVDDQSRDAKIRVDDLTREQRKADADVEQVKTRRSRDQDRMHQGLITNPKDLARMQSELVSLSRRISDLEDVELEVMEQLESAQAEYDRLVARLTELDTRADELTRSRDDKAGAIRAEVTEAAHQRTAVASGVADDLLTLYDRLREQKGGVGAAPLRARRCGGCSLEVNPSDLGRIAKASMDEVVRCEECNRILVRTPESGL